MLAVYFRAQKFDLKTWISAWTGGKGTITEGSVFSWVAWRDQAGCCGTALWLLFWKAGHVFLACKLLFWHVPSWGQVAAAGRREAPAQLSHHGATGHVGRRGKPFWILAVIILEFTWPQMPALQSYFLTKIQGAVGSGWAQDIEVIKEKKLRYNEGKSGHPSFGATCL